MPSNAKSALTGPKDTPATCPRARVPAARPSGSPGEPPIWNCAPIDPAGSRAAGRGRFDTRSPDTCPRSPIRLPRSISRDPLTPTWAPISIILRLSSCTTLSAYVPVTLMFDPTNVCPGPMAYSTFGAIALTRTTGSLTGPLSLATTHPRPRAETLRAAAGSFTDRMSRARSMPLAETAMSVVGSFKPLAAPTTRTSEPANLPRTSRMADSPATRIWASTSRRLSVESGTGEFRPAMRTTPLREEKSGRIFGRIFTPKSMSITPDVGAYRLGSGAYCAALGTDRPFKAISARPDCSSVSNRASTLSAPKTPSSPSIEQFTESIG